MLLQLIEEKREVLLCLGKTYGLTAKETVICSQELDQLLNRLDDFISEPSDNS
ncbi:aspartyl-phosphate phosphatase Spo0E family protein [Fictibacillus sp. 5RED26]|uniref:aspartyl-phosphate phosphatase Spo0E family protein n=1 Tax=Bacillales TaxID=1385 RepID=UPI0010F49595|nr:MULTISPECIES: aspartyl-phosphate phosphatase Spo0E family protein [Bacillaceae]MBH0154984.1 aspartyl-phosphate phosphatase Spo0E family protein [Fictibacillus sp. 5RED26]MBH0172174.1 aspartyl-phosphate phosphatase Spo0E family protein [Fictibacillus sp. 23RED33]